MTPGDDPSQRSLGGARLLGLGTACAACVIVGMVLGHLADNQLDSAPAGVLVGMASGILLAILGAVFEIRRYLD